jgi:hypothetical protein
MCFYQGYGWCLPFSPYMSIGPTFAANGPTSTILQINMTIRGGGKEVVFTLYQRFALF